MQTKELRELERRFIGRNRLDESDAEELRRALLSDDGKISRKEASLLVKLRERVPDRTEGFERFFYRAIRNYLLDDDLLSATEWKWLWEVLFADDRIDEREAELLCRLKEGARVVNPEFDALLLACLEARRKQGGAG
jgi:hypothetical protein